MTSSLWVSLALLFAVSVAWGQSPEVGKNVDAAGKYTPQAPPSGASLSREDAEAKMRGSLQIEREGSDKIRIGTVVLDTKHRTVTFPAAVNMNEGIVEYAVVTDYGKVHEALFKTTAKPQEIHLACLLLSHGVPKEAAPVANGQSVQISVCWETNGPEVERDLAQMVMLAKDPANPANTEPLPSKLWTYTGSVTDAQGFAAAREGSIVSLISDSCALINKLGESAKQDDHHMPNKRVMPAKGSPVRMVLHFAEKPNHTERNAVGIPVTPTPKLPLKN